MCHGISSGLFPLTFTFKQSVQAAREAAASTTPPPTVAAVAISTRAFDSEGGESWVILAWRLL